jgi:hypothetical protein
MYYQMVISSPRELRLRLRLLQLLLRLRLLLLLATADSLRPIRLYLCLFALIAGGRGIGGLDVGEHVVRA